jgi:hypothetical protein
MNRLQNVQSDFKLQLEEFYTIYKNKRASGNKTSLIKMINEFVDFTPIFDEDEYDDDDDDDVEDDDNRKNQFQTLKYFQNFPVNPPRKPVIKSIENSKISNSDLYLSKSNNLVLNANNTQANDLSKLLYLQLCGMANTHLPPMYAVGKVQQLPLKTKNNSEWLKRLNTNFKNQILSLAIQIFGTPRPTSNLRVRLESCANNAICGKYFIVRSKYEVVTPEIIVNLKLEIHVRPEFFNTTKTSSKLTANETFQIMTKLFMFENVGEAVSFRSSFIAAIFILLMNGILNKTNKFLDENITIQEILPKRFLAQREEEEEENKALADRRRSRKTLLQKERRAKK